MPMSSAECKELRCKLFFFEKYICVNGKKQLKPLNKNTHQLTRTQRQHKLITLKKGKISLKQLERCRQLKKSMYQN